MLGITSIRSYKTCILSLSVVAFLSVFKFYLHIFDLNPLPLLIYPMMFISACLLTFKKINFAQIYIILTSELITSLVSSCLTTMFFDIFIAQTNARNILSLLCVRFIYFLIIFNCFFRGANHVKNIYYVSKTIPKHIFVLILFSNFLITFLAEINNHPNQSISKQNTITILIMLLSIFLIVIIFSLLINVASKNYYTALNSLLEKQVEAQITHYEKLEELNKDIRQLRHDYINHLTSIGTLIEHKNYPDALQYIERLTESTHCNETIYSTGNHLADAILTGKSSECKEFADIEFNGIITDRINNTDMCAILANALDNAIEACRKCSGRSKISIAAQNKQGYWVMTMRNPTIGEDSEGLMKTSKEDTQNHGFGLLSIEQAVKRYDGNIKVGIKDGIFEISIVVKD